MGEQVYERYSFDFNDEMAKPVDNAEHGKPFKLSEIRRYNNFVPSGEEESALYVVATLGWETSQSNVRKQEYGPVIDFAAKTLDCKANTGLPRYSRNLLRRLQDVSGLDFKADRLRLLELCSGHDTVKFPWVSSPYHDHHWLFTDTTVLMSLQSDIVVCLDRVVDGSHVVRVEVPMQARSALVLRGDATRRQINVDASSCLTRCLLLTCNCVRADPAGASEADLQCIEYFRDKYVGIANNEFVVKFGGCVYTDSSENVPLMVYSFSQHHLPLDVLKSVIEQNYMNLSIQEIKVIDGFADTNLVIEKRDKSKVWGKLAIHSLYITESTLEAGLRLQNWMSDQMDVRVAKVIRPGVEMSMEESRRTSISTGHFSIAIERNRIHLVWLLEYLDDPKLYDQQMSVEACFQKVGRTIILFHKQAAKYLDANLTPESDEQHFRHFLTPRSVEADLDVFYKKAFLAPDHNKRKLLVCCVRRLQRCFQQYEEISAPEGVIHTYFHPESLLGDVNSPGPFTIVHFAHIRYGFLLTDIILALLRFYIFFRIRLGEKTPPFEDCMNHLLAGYGRRLDGAEKDHLDSFLLSLCAIYLVETCEQLAMAIAEVEQVPGSAKSAIAEELRKSVQAGFELLEYLCVNEKKLG